ncbi:hypothetical protein D3C73_1472790 [compost metagenome]
MQYCNLVALENRRQPMGDGDGRSAPADRIPCLMNGLLCFEIQCRGRFVEDENPGVLEINPGNAQPLLLSSG